MTRSLAIALAALLCAALALAATAAPAAPAGATASTEKIVIAPVSKCPGQSESSADTATKATAMLCMTNFARAANGLKPLTASKPLRRAAAHKSADILACDEFSHEACGRDFTFWIERSGYLSECGAAGENIAWGTGTLGTVRSIFSAWINSSGHRANILGRYTDIGIAYAVGTLEGNAGAVVWTQDFGSHSC
jgi:uncharacterized protein YkwD